MDVYEALLAKAVWAVLHPDHDAFLRHAKRYVSRTFHIPLLELENMSEMELLSIYYEGAFEEMGEDDRAELIHKLLETDVERQKRVEGEKKAESNDEAFFDNLNAEVLSGMARRPSQKKGKAPVKMSKAVQPKKVDAKSTSQPKQPPPMPEIHMNFQPYGNEEESNLPNGWGELSSLARGSRNRDNIPKKK